MVSGKLLTDFRMHAFFQNTHQRRYNESKNHVPVQATKAVLSPSWWSTIKAFGKIQGSTSASHSQEVADKIANWIYEHSNALLQGRRQGGAAPQSTCLAPPIKKLFFRRLRLLRLISNFGPS